MTLFFFHVGLHIKREFVFGEFRQGRAMILPLMAAIGGMVVPALIFTVIREPCARSAWGIPMATDIALVVGVLALLGNRVPNGLKVFILSLAIIDDVGAILVIAVFYSSHIALMALAVAALLLGVITGLNRLGVRQVPASCRCSPLPIPPSPSTLGCWHRMSPSGLRWGWRLGSRWGSWYSACWPCGASTPPSWIG